jgi:alpha-beta hydrolase superfamily lysophospholipase
LAETFRATDGYLWSYDRYPAAEKSRGRVVFLHGIRSHSGWYRRSCSQIAAAGWDVYFLNRRGAGPNQQDRGDAPGFRRLLDDIAEFLAVDEKPKTVLAGISWGGKLAAAFPNRHPGRINGLMMLCPGLRARIRPSRRRRWAVIASRLFAPTKLFPIPLNEPELFTASPEWQRFIADDALGLKQATARFLFASTQLEIYLRRAAKAVTCPSLLLLAGKDRIIDNAGTWQVAQRFSGGRTVIEYPDAHHTLEFEPDGHPFVADMVKWLDGIG